MNKKGKRMLVVSNYQLFDLSHNNSRSILFLFQGAKKKNNEQYSFCSGYIM